MHTTLVWVSFLCVSLSQVTADEPARRSFRSTANGNSNWIRRTKVSRASGSRWRRHSLTKSWCPVIGRRRASASLVASRSTTTKARRGIVAV